MIDIDHRSGMQLRQLLLGRRYRSRYRFTTGNCVKLFSSGNGLFASLIDRIDAAVRDVALETYIFCDDAVGRAVSSALTRAAARGVRVRVITDGIGTARLALFDAWREAGVEHRIYNPHLFGRFGFSRTHRKLAVIDDTYAYCGGINVVDDLDQNGKPLPFPRWDFAVELSGPVVVDVREAIELQWRRIRLGYRPPLQTAAASASPLFPAVPATAGVVSGVAGVSGASTGSCGSGGSQGLGGSGGSSNSGNSHGLSSLAGSSGLAGSGDSSGLGDSHGSSGSGDSSGSNSSGGRSDSSDDLTDSAGARVSNGPIGPGTTPPARAASQPSSVPPHRSGPHRPPSNPATRLIERLRARLRASVRDPRTAQVPCVAFVARDNIVNRRAIEKAYLDAIGEARTEVLLANPYFMPGRRLRRALVDAAARGVSVKLLIGRKEFAFLDLAVPFLYRALLSGGVQIAEYEKTMLHGKVAVVDSKWGTVGSSNLDALSLMLNNEANVLMVLHPEIDALRDAILAAFGDATPIDRAHYDARPAFERAISWLAYATYRAAMKLLTVGGYD